MKRQGRPTVVIAPKGCSEYLTAGKEYKVVGYYGFVGFYIVDNDGDKISCREKHDGFLHNQNWIVKSREGDKKTLKDISAEYFLKELNTHIDKYLDEHSHCSTPTCDVDNVREWIEETTKTLLK